METLAAVLKAGLQPASVTFVEAVLAAGLLLMVFRPTRQFARGYWFAVLLGYTLFATPLVADWLIGRMAGDFRRIERLEDARGANVIVVLGAGARTFRDGSIAVNLPMPGTVTRTMEGARLYRLLGSPTVILSGGVTDLSTPNALAESEAMRDVILRLGVPEDRVILESVSRTTREEADAVKRLLGGRAGDPMLLVTSPSHMHRSLAVFREAGMNPVAAVTPVHSDRTPVVCRWCPSDEALSASSTVAYDAVAWWYYRARGWVHP